VTPAVTDIDLADEMQLKLNMSGPHLHALMSHLSTHRYGFQSRFKASIPGGLVPNFQGYAQSINNLSDHNGLKVLFIIGPEHLAYMGQMVEAYFSEHLTDRDDFEPILQLAPEAMYDSSLATHKTPSSAKRRHERLKLIFHDWVRSPYRLLSLLIYFSSSFSASL
jgi:hypothetical protein